MATREAFLADVIENPDDDAPRLVFADWLDDHGEPERAELIRTQIELARRPPGGRQPRKLLGREKKLLDAHGREWAQPLRPFVVQFQYRRGFVEAVVMNDDHEDFPGAVRQVMALTPLRALRLGQVALQGGLPELPQAGECLRNLQELYVLYSYEAFAEDLRPLFESELFTGLTSLLLDLDAFGCDPEILRLLRPAGVLPSLRRLGLCLGTEADPQEDAVLLAALLEAKSLRGLRSLHLQSFGLGEHAAALPGCPAFSSLEVLDLQDSAAPAEHWRSLLLAPETAGLRELWLTNAHVFDEGEDAEPLVGSEVWAEVEERLAAIDVHDDESPVTLPWWEGLEF